MNVILKNELLDFLESELNRLRINIHARMGLYDRCLNTRGSDDEYVVQEGKAISKLREREMKFEYYINEIRHIPNKKEES